MQPVTTQTQFLIMITIVFHFSLKDKGMGKRVKGRILVQTAGHQYLSFDLLVQIHYLGV